jgi:hypothetical protein
LSIKKRDIATFILGILVTVVIGALVVANSHIGTLLWNAYIEQKRSTAKLAVWQVNHFHLGGEDERTEIELRFRNLSHRPTAIIDIFVRGKDGIFIGGSGYKNNIKLPIQLEPWQAIQKRFRIDRNDEARMANILVRDIEDNEIVVVRGPDKKWIKAK